MTGLGSTMRLHAQSRTPVFKKTVYHHCCAPCVGTGHSMRFIVCCMSDAIYAECNSIKMVMHDHENTRDSPATMAGPVLALSHHGKCTLNGLVLWGKHGGSAGSLMTCRTAVRLAQISARTPCTRSGPSRPLHHCLQDTRYDRIYSDS